MSQVVDNLIAYRVLSMLVKPFPETEAYKLGIIDGKGQNLIKPREFTTVDQKNSYTYLHRLVFNLKKLLNKLPGGESKLKNIVAAFFLIKEAYGDKTLKVNEEQLHKLISLMEEGVVFAEEQLVVEEFLSEEAPANVTGANVSTDQPVIRKAKRPVRRFGRFIVNDDLYGKFAKGKTKYKQWKEYLDLNDEGHRMIYEFAKKNPNAVIILHNGKNTKAIRFNRKGGGSWSKIKRK